MALPNLRMLRDDLFVINRRITANDVETYKINAEDIGVFLLETPRPPGSSPDDKFVNDGELNVYGEIPMIGQGSINLHSANEYCEGKLNFSEDFYITGTSMDVLVRLNYAQVTDEISCNSSGGIDGSGDCLKLDMTWLSGEIICDGKGLDNSCGTGIGIDLCDHSGLQFPAEGCLQVNLCGNDSIIHHPMDGCIMVNLNYLSNNLSCNGLRPSDGDIDASCMEIDMDWLANNIRCGDLHDPLGTNSGLIDGGGCIEIDPCWVGDRLNPQNTQYSFSDGDAESIDTNGCRLRINPDWLLQWAKDNIHDIKNSSTSSCLTIDGSNLFEEDVDIKLDEACLVKLIRDEIDSKAITGISGDSCILVDKSDLSNVKLSFNTSCGGSGTGTPTPPNDGVLTIKEGTNGIRITATNGKTHSANTKKNTTWTIDMDPASCPDFDEAISCKKLHLKESGGSGEPGIVIGTRQAATGACIPGNGSDTGVNPDGSCKYGTKAWLGISSNQQNGSFTCIRGIEGWKDYDDCGGKPKGETEKLFSVAAGTKVLPHHASSGLITSNTALAEDLRVFRYNQKPGDDDNPNGIVGGRPDQGLYNRFCFRKVNFLRGDIQEISRSSDTRINFNIDDVIDTFGGFNDDPEVTDGIFRWGLKPLDEDPTHSYPFLFIDYQELAEKLPGFVDFTPDSTAWEINESTNELGEVIDVDFNLKDDFDPATQLEPGAINWQAVHAVAIAAIAKHKKRIEELESLTTKSGMLNVLGIIEYTNETAAVNSGLGKGEVYWDTSLNRMRAVT